MFWVWVAVFTVAIAGIFLIKNLSGFRRAKEREIILGAKVDAYGDHLRRTTSDEDFLDMSEAELKDYIRSVVKDYEKATFDMRLLMGAMIATGVGLGVIYGLVDQSWLTFLGLSFGGLLVGLLIKKFGVDPIRQRLTEKTGIEIERLLADR